MHFLRQVTLVIAFISLLPCTTNPLNFEGDQNSCFCMVQGEIEDCDCNVSSIDAFNSDYVFPKVERLLKRDYFRYYQVDLFRACPFPLPGNSQCTMRTCAVEESDVDKIPAGLKETVSSKKLQNRKKEQSHRERDSASSITEENNEELFGTHGKNAPKVSTDCSVDKLDFCDLEDLEAPDAAFYDIQRNPEKFTGYSGASSVNVWKLIYEQDCFRPDVQVIRHSASLKQEKEAFLRIISGLHTSISVDVAANWLFPGKHAIALPQWGPNLNEFFRRFHPSLTSGDGPRRLKNMYFAYLVQIRALVKAFPSLCNETFFTGNDVEDREVKQLVSELLQVLRSFPDHFDESKLFVGEADQYKEDFKVQFRNVSRIMDCVGCIKCKLWGKLQITGLGTALKILFCSSPLETTEPSIHLRRSEIVALINSFGKLSKGIQEIQKFRVLMGQSEQWRL